MEFRFADGTGPRPPVVVVLGGSGYIGSAVVDVLAPLPVRLRVVARTPVPVAPAAELHRLDLAVPGAVGDAVGDADVVIHLAAHIGGAKSWRTAGAQTRRMNVDLMREVVTAVRAQPVVVFASTLQASTAGPHGEYVDQKVEAEEILRQATAAGAARGVVLRLTTVYGRSPSSGSTGRGVISAMARKAVTGEPITMWHDGSVTRDLLHVRDAAHALVTALDHAPALSGEPWAVGTGRPARLGAVFTSLARIVAERTGRPPVPVVTVQPPDYAESNDFHSPAVDCSPFTTATGWRPRVPLRAGLADVVEAVLD